MSFFDEVYDDMKWEEVCYRLPSDLAVNALLRRINNLETLRMFFENTGDQTSNISAIKDRVNSILADEEPDDILKELSPDKFEKVLFNWMNDDNRKRILHNDPANLSMKFIFNATDSDDSTGLNAVLDRVLGDAEINQSHLRAILNKANDTVFADMLSTILRDARPEVRVSVLGIAGATNNGLISDLQKTIGLKALAKCESNKPTSSISVLPVAIFGNLKPLERLTALEKYLGYFPTYRKVQAFSPAPTREEFDLILFAGCIEHNDMVTRINETYHLITEAELPVKEEDEE